MNVRARKIFTAVMLVAVLTVLAAGAASARGWGHRGRGGYMGGGYGPCAGGGYYGGGRWGGDYFDGPRGGGRGGYYNNGAYAGELPQEIRDKIAEAQKIAVDLRNELGRNPINKERALELHKRHGAIMQEVSDWRFQQNIEENITR